MTYEELLQAKAAGLRVTTPFGTGKVNGVGHGSSFVQLPSIQPGTLYHLREVDNGDFWRLTSPSYEDFAHLTGSVQLEYLPTDKSRKWRKGPIRGRYTELAFDDALTLAHQEGWEQWRYVAW